MIQSRPPTSPHAGGAGCLVRLDPDHPGFRDPEYRARRDAIARVALEYQPSSPIPVVEYTAAEHRVWRTVWEHLGPLHQDLACRELVDLSRVLGLSRERIPQLRDLNRTLEAATGFQMQPVAGLVRARTFLSYLGDSVFLSTQYVRHRSTPLYTPEPDVIHELVGHAATLVHPGIAGLNQAMGQAAQEAGDEELPALERVYWHTLEFGAVREAGEVKAFGAGLLSSYGEIQRFADVAELLDWDLERMATTPYEPTAYQPRIFVAPSFDRLLQDLREWVDSGRWRG